MPVSEKRRAASLRRSSLALAWAWASTICSLGGGVLSSFDREKDRRRMEAIGGAAAAAAIVMRYTTFLAEF